MDAIGSADDEQSGRTTGEPGRVSAGCLAGVPEQTPGADSTGLALKKSDALRALRRSVVVAWVSAMLAIGLLWGQFLASVLHPWGRTFAALAVVAAASLLACLVIGLWRIVRGPRRWAALGLTGMGLVPAGLVASVVLAGAMQYRRGEIGRSVPFIFFAMAGASLGEVEAPWKYPHRLESAHLIMYFGDNIKTPERDLDAMEKHVTNLVRMTRRPLRAKIAWIRGSLLGQSRLSVGGLALASDASPAEALDRHELAHAVIYQAMSPSTRPPMLLAEGWAESRSQDPVKLAEAALYARSEIERLASRPVGEVRQHLAGWHDGEGWGQLVAMRRAGDAHTMSYVRELTGPFWYHRDKGPTYAIGGGFADHIVRTYGADRFVALYLACRPGRFDEACWAVLNRTTDEVERDFWLECERMTGKRR